MPTFSLQKGVWKIYLRLQQQIKEYQSINNKIFWTAKRNSFSILAQQTLQSHGSKNLPVTLRACHSCTTEQRHHASSYQHVRDTTHDLLHFITPVHAVQRCTRPSPTRIQCCPWLYTTACTSQLQYSERAYSWRLIQIPSCTQSVPAVKTSSNHRWLL